MTWWQSLPWSACAMICCYAALVLIGLYLLYDGIRSSRPKRPDVLHRNGQFRDS